MIMYDRRRIRYKRRAGRYSTAGQASFQRGLLLSALFMASSSSRAGGKPSLRRGSGPAPLGERLRRLVICCRHSCCRGRHGQDLSRLATPTESAALGVIMSLVLCGVHGRLSIKMLAECFVTTVSVTAMIMLITTAAFYLNFVLGLMGVPQALASFAAISAHPNCR